MIDMLPSMPEDGRLWYTRRGAGSPLLLIQGTAATHLHWGERLFSLLAASFDVVAYDHRGVGRSAFPEGSFTVPDLADDAAALLDSIGWSCAHIFGVSMGGVVAQELALRHPERVASLVLGCTNTGGATPTASTERPTEALASAIVRGDEPSTLRNVFSLGVKDLDSVRPGAWVEYRDAAQMLPVSPRTAALQIGAVSRHSTADRLHQIAAPTHVVHGDADRLIHINAGKQVADAIRNARFTSLSAGHFFWLERPDDTTDLLARHALRN